MSDSPLSKNQILADAAALYQSLQADCDATTVAAIKRLCLQLRDLHGEYLLAQSEAKSISAKIGQAKRGNKPVAELVTAMQQQSLQLRLISKQTAQIEREILGFFDLADDNKKAEAETTSNPDTRSYPLSSCDISAISVSLDGKHDEWNAYVSGNSAASVYHRAEWPALIEKTYGHEGYYFTARDKDHRIVGVLPLIRLRSRLFGDLLVSMPYFMTGGAVADHPAIEHKLMQAANDHAATLGAEHIEYRDDIPRESLPSRIGKVNMILTLPSSENELWNSFSSKLRSQIRRPQRENPQILIGGNEYLDEFYTVYAQNMRDLGSPVHSKLFIKNILECFSDESRIIVIRLKNRPVSAGLLISNGDTLEIPLASTTRDANHLSMNMLLYWKILQYAVESNYKLFNFGRSSTDAGTYKFKQQWGAKPRQLFWNYWLNGSDQLPSLNPSNPKYALMISTWKRLPVFISKWLGPKIVKNLP